jgi:hypothetical protein
VKEVSARRQPKEKRMRVATGGTAALFMCYAERRLTNQVRPHLTEKGML